LQDEDQHQQEDGAERQRHPQAADPAALLGHMPGVSLTEAADYLCSGFILHLVEGGISL
jgi:hypothetical protein